MKATIRTMIMGMLAIGMIACSSPKKLLKNENFDASITRSLKKIRGAGDKAKLKHLATLAEAFSEANHRNLLTIDRLRKEGKAANWIQINNLYNQIIDRQSKVAPYADDAAEFGIDVYAYLEDYSGAELSSRKRAALYFYNKATAGLEDARQGDKLAARDAFYYLNKIDRYFDEYKDKELLKNEAVYLGKEEILVNVVNRSRAIIPSRLGNRMLDFGVENLNDIFHQYYTSADAGVEFDYQLNINIIDMIVTPESEQVDRYVDTKEVADGFDYVLDDNGNVLKDTSGNDIKIDRFKTIRARVEEVRQFKAVALSGNVEYFDMDGNRVLRTEPIEAEAVFENFAASFDGDREALTEESRRKIGNRPLPFPQTEYMLEDAVELIRPVILRTIQRIKA